MAGQSVLALGCMLLGVAARGGDQGVLSTDDEMGLHVVDKGMTHAVMLSKQRCGTQWFLDLLNQHPHMRFETELMSSKDHEEGKVKSTLRDFRKRDTDYDKRLNVTVHGFKWMQNQPEEEPFTFDGTTDKDMDYVMGLKEDKFKVILFERPASIRYLLSLSEKTDSPTLNTSSVTIASSAEELAHNHTVARKLDQIEENWQNAEAFLSKHFSEEKLLVLQYDLVVAHPQAWINKVFRFFDLDDFDVVLTDNQTKGASLKDALTDYEQVLEEVNGTKWEKELLAD